MAPLLADLKTREINIITVQEPYHQKRMFATHCPRSCGFWPAYPEGEHARACFLVNKRIPSHLWSVDFLAENLVVLTIQQADSRLNIINIYSPLPESYNHVDSNSLIH